MITIRGGMADNGGKDLKGGTESEEIQKDVQLTNDCRSSR